jgi:PAS domain S-box-containing protein
MRMHTVVPQIVGFTKFDPVLYRSAGLFEKVFLSHPDSVLILATGYAPNIVDCNLATEKMFGYSRKRLIGRPVNHLYADQSSMRQRSRTVISNVRQKGFCCFPELWMRRQDGTVFPSEHTVTPLCDESKNCFGWVAITHDITERFEKEKRLSDSAEKIKQFAYSICHDLKNPTIALRWFVERLAERYGHLMDEQGNICFDRIRKTSDEIIHLVDGLNTFISTRERPLSIDEVSLDEIFQTVKEQFLQSAETLGVKLSAQQCQVKLRADKMSLIRALRNLVENALKHGGEKLSEISLGHAESDEFHIISVKDDGAGLKGEGEEIFELFKRGGRSKGVPGAGLGLGIVKEIALCHGGSISIGRGPRTEFLLSISKRL